MSQQCWSVTDSCFQLGLCREEINICETLAADAGKSLGLIFKQLELQVLEHVKRRVLGHETTSGFSATVDEN